MSSVQRQSPPSHRRARSRLTSFPLLPTPSESHCHGTDFILFLALDAAACRLPSVPIPCLLPFSKPMSLFPVVDDAAAATQHAKQPLSALLERDQHSPRSDASPTWPAAIGREEGSPHVHVAMLAGGNEAGRETQDVQTDRNTAHDARPAAALHSIAVSHSLLSLGRVAGPAHARETGLFSYPDHTGEARLGTRRAVDCPYCTAVLLHCPQLGPSCLVMLLSFLLACLLGCQPVPNAA